MGMMGCGTLTLTACAQVKTLQNSCIILYCPGKRPSLCKHPPPKFDSSVVNSGPPCNRPLLHSESKVNYYPTACVKKKLNT